MDINGRCTEADTKRRMRKLRGLPTICPKLAKRINRDGDDDLPEIREQVAIAVSEIRRKVHGLPPVEWGGGYYA